MIEVRKSLEIKINKKHDKENIALTFFTFKQKYEFTENETLWQ